jgi:hypothetical protein
MDRSIEGTLASNDGCSGPACSLPARSCAGGFQFLHIRQDVVQHGASCGLIARARRGWEGLTRFGNRPEQPGRACHTPSPTSPRVAEVQLGCPIDWEGNNRDPSSKNAASSDRHCRFFCGRPGGSVPGRLGRCSESYERLIASGLAQGDYELARDQDYARLLKAGQCILWIGGTARPHMLLACSRDRSPKDPPSTSTGSGAVSCHKEAAEPSNRRTSSPNGQGRGTPCAQYHNGKHHKERAAPLCATGRTSDLRRDERNRRLHVGMEQRGPIAGLVWTTREERAFRTDGGNAERACRHRP